MPGHRAGNPIEIDALEVEGLRDGVALGVERLRCYGVCLDQCWVQLRTEDAVIAFSTERCLGDAILGEK